MDSYFPQSPTMRSARLSFLDTRLALIHIPLEAFELFVQPIIRLLMHNDNRDDLGHIVEPSKPWMFWHPFVHVSVTPECFVVCPRQEAESLFLPVIERLSSRMKKLITVNSEDYSAILIAGEGLDACQRVLDLTCPLAMAGVSIRFITSYYSDFILVPYPARADVIRTLENQGFVFEAGESGDAGHMTGSPSPSPQPANRDSFMSDLSLDITQPSTNVCELQSKTFAMIKQHHIALTVDDGLELVTCAGVKDGTASTSANNNAEGKLQLGITKCLTSTPPPRFLAITLTDSESASFTLDRNLLAYFYNDGENLLLGKDGPEQVAINLDLRDLPRERTGVICGVASSLKSGMTGRSEELFNLGYLSTMKSGHVIVYADELDDALDVLNGSGRNGQ